MKGRPAHFRNIIFLFLILAFKAPPGHADLTMVQEIETFDEEKVANREQIVTHISGKRLRMDMGQAMSSIVLADKKVTYSILHAARQYVVLPHSAPENPDLKDEGPSHEPKGNQLQKTDKTGQISGFFCREVLEIPPSFPSHETRELWISEGGMDFQAFRKQIQPWGAISIGGLLSILEKNPGFQGIPIRVVQYERNKMKTRSTIKKLDANNIPDGVFEVPAGYEEIKPVK